jgi:hypothetical protein
MCFYDGFSIQNSTIKMALPAFFRRALMSLLKKQKTFAQIKINKNLFYFAANENNTEHGNTPFFHCCQK